MSARKSSMAKYLRVFVPRHLAKPKSCSSAASSASLSSHSSSCSLDVGAEGVDAVENPFRLWHLRSLSKDSAALVERRFARVKHLVVRKQVLDSVQIDAETGGAVFAGNRWFAHPVAHNVLARFVQDDSVEFVAGATWSSKDVAALHNAIGMFRCSVERVELDAPIIEMIIASLSMIDLDRWYAFLCFMKAVNNPELHLAVDHTASGDQIYFPVCRELSIRTTESDSSHLARILDYGVRSRLVVDRHHLEVLNVTVTDVAEPSGERACLNRNLYQFRCWAGSAGFDDRYRQQFVNCI